MEETPKNHDEGASSNNSADVLSDMPSFEEHMSTKVLANHVDSEHQSQDLMNDYRRKRFDGELPDGVRDFQDYQEYLEMQKAKSEETTRHFDEIYNYIEQMENRHDRDLAIGLLGVLQPDKTIGGRKNHEVNFKVFNDILETIKDSGGDSIEEFLHNKSKQALYSGDKETARASSSYLNALEITRIVFSNKMDQEKNKNDFFKIEYNGGKWLFLETETSPSVTRLSESELEWNKKAVYAARAWAKEIFNSAKQDDTLLETEHKQYLLGGLSEINNSCLSVKEKIDRDSSNTAKKISKTIASATRNTDPRSATVSLWDSGILEAAWDAEIREYIKQSVENYDDYLKTYLPRGLEKINS